MLIPFSMNKYYNCLDNSSIVISDDDETLNTSNNVSVVDLSQVNNAGIYILYKIKIHFFPCGKNIIFSLPS